MADETTVSEEEEEVEEHEKRAHGSGPGFILGAALGALAGVAAATLFAPGPEDEDDGRRRMEEPEGPFGAARMEPAPAPAPREPVPAAQGPAPAEPPAPTPPAPLAAPEEEPLDRIRAMLARVRTRVEDAREEGRQARREEEAEMRARYERLIHQQESRP